MSADGVHVRPRRSSASGLHRRCDGIAEEKSARKALGTGFLYRAVWLGMASKGKARHDGIGTLGQVIGRMGQPLGQRPPQPNAV
jgi:hypothetical protein